MLTLCSSELDQNNDEQLEEQIQIHTSHDSTDITWKNGSGQAQSIDNILLKVDIDSLISKAIFKLVCRVWIKGKGKNKAQRQGIEAGDRQSVYMFILPENIRAITLEVIHDVSLLHFSLTDGHSRLVVPSDRVLECKHSTLPRLHLMKTLSEIDEFTMHFKSSDMTRLAPHHLLQIASIFSATNANRPATDDRRTKLQTLYSGIGGHVFDASTIPAGANNERDQALPEDTSAPPPFDCKHTLASLMTISKVYLIQFQMNLAANTNIFVNANASANVTANLPTLIMILPLAMIAPPPEHLMLDLAT